jgi:rare lipoprotein A (peptidoglycan hydrolase)
MNPPRFFRAPALFGFVALFAVGCSNASSSRHPFEPSGSIAASRIDNTRGLNNTRGRGLGSTRIVTASWYGPGYEGKQTASGERFDPNRFTGASSTLPLGSIVRVTNLGNGRSVTVKVNDRGPGFRRRGLDLSPAAARRIGLTRPGVARVKITPVTDPTIE